MGSQPGNHRKLTVSQLGTVHKTVLGRDTRKCSCSTPWSATGPDVVRQGPLGGGHSCNTPATHSKLQKEPARGVATPWGARGGGVQRLRHLGRNTSLKAVIYADISVKKSRAVNSVVNYVGNTNF